MMRWAALLAFLSAWMALPAASQEARCTALGSDCIASEPLNNSDTISSATSWDPSDSTTKEWIRASGNAFEWGVQDASQAHMVASTMIGANYAAGASAMNVFRYDDAKDTVVLWWNWAPGSGVDRASIRWYMRVDYDRPGISNYDNPAIPCDQDTGIGCGGDTCHSRWKLLDASYAGSAEFQAEANIFENAVFPCPGSGDSDYSAFENNQRGIPPYPSADLSPRIDGSNCKKDIDGNGGWCRMEFILTNTGSDVTGELITHAVDDNITGTSGALTMTGKQISDFTDIHINNFCQDIVPGGLGTDSCGGFEISHVLWATWATASGQTIGAASEIEGSGGGPAGPVPSGAAILLIGAQLR